MIKSILFLSLYAAAGIGSWGAYSFISEQDSSLISLTKLATQLQPKLLNHQTEDETIYRWKDNSGNWNYENTPRPEHNFDSYKDELITLQKFQKEQTLSNLGEKQTASSTTLPSSESELLSPATHIQKLFKDAENIQNLVNDRKKQLDEITNYSKK